MSDPQRQTNPDDKTAALFAHLVIQQTNMALMLLGHVPHPETGERVQDLEAAQMLIDQLGMIEVKTKGNLLREEEQLLKQSLTNLRMAFVEAIEAHPQPAPAEVKAAPHPPSGSGPAQAPAQEPENEESRKKFSKKY